MPLVTCPDCASEISSLAPSCPKCGRPAPFDATPDPPSGITDSTGHAKRTAGGPWILGCAVAIVAVLGLFALVGMVGHSGSPGGTQTDASKPSSGEIPCSPVMQTSADALNLIDREVARTTGATITVSQTSCRRIGPNQDAAEILTKLTPARMNCQAGAPVHMGKTLALVSASCRTTEGLMNFGIGYESATGEMVLVVNGLSRK